MSVACPAGKGTMMRTGLTGYCCPKTLDARASASAAPSKRAKIMTYSSTTHVIRGEIGVRDEPTAPAPRVRTPVLRKKLRLELTKRSESPLNLLPGIKRWGLFGDSSAH